MNSIVESHPPCANILHPFIGGEEILSSPSVRPTRWIIDFEDMSLEMASSRYAPLLEIVRHRVKPERDKIKAKSTRENWWKFHRSGAAIRSIMRSKDRILVHPFTCSHLGFVFLDSETYIAAPHFAFAIDDWPRFSILQSRIHEEWVRLTSSTLKDDTRYTASDCLDTFAFPRGLYNNLDTPCSGGIFQDLEEAGRNYYQLREEVMRKTESGLTKLYNAFHDPGSASEQVKAVRLFHEQLDHAVFKSYGWEEIPITCGFGLDYLDLEDDAQLPDELQERIDISELFFWDANDALDFQGQLEAYGAISGRRKLPWRYRWPDAVRDDVLARLLALNAERYAEEVAMGLHSKGAKKTSGAKRGRKTKGPRPRCWCKSPWSSTPA